MKNQKKLKSYITFSGLFISLFLITIFFSSLTIADEGMYPLSEIKKLDLKSKGLKVTATDIYNPDGVSLVDAVVNIGGCTGSFVSPNGLIITNHHCAFGAVQAASTPEKDLVTNGFLAESLTEEIPAKGFTVRIVDSYRDVSESVLAVLNDTMDFATRSKAIDRRIKEIITETENKNPGKRAEISEMFIGSTYVLFIYTYLQDVRLVYVPPRSIGEFGGENDNWIWPRHTGDFSFIRAYVAPDGSPAGYSQDNVPYHPKKYLKIGVEGVDENDPVFILGYPGRTYRHRTASYLAFEEEVRMPYIADLYEWQISVMENMGKEDRAISLKLDGRIKGLANTMKNYRGKLQGLKRLQLVSKKREEEQLLQSFIDSDPNRKKWYGSVLSDINSIYEEMRSRIQYEFTLDYILQSSNLISLAKAVLDASREREKPDIERASAYMDRNFTRTRESLLMSLSNYYEPIDKIFLKRILMQAVKLPENQRISPIDKIISGDNPETAINMFIDKLYSSSKLMDKTYLEEALTKSYNDLTNLNDPCLEFVQSLLPLYDELRAVRQRRDGALSKLYALLVDAKKLYLKKDFIPDANSTLRLTFGKIKGYSPADALYSAPITTVKGIIEKTTGTDPYATPKKLIELHKGKNFGRWKHKRLNDVPVALLYNLDTTGGNSGSPLLNGS